MLYRRTFVLTFLLLLLPAYAYALDAEFIVYNGFDPTVGALQKVALIFSDIRFEMLVYVMATLGIVVGVLTAVGQGMLGKFVGPISSWAWPVGIGVILYLGLVVPKGNITVYDPVKNQFQTVGGIPDGMVALLGGLNKIETGLIEIVSTAGDPLGYDQQAGGVGFDLLLGIDSDGILLPDQYIIQALRNYTKNCVFFEMTRPGSSLSLNDLAANTDFLPLFDQAASPAIYTTYYDETFRTGISMSCTESWASIRSYLSNPLNYQNDINTKCANAGFDPTIPVELNQCKAAITNVLNWVEAPATYSIEQLFRQMLMAKMISDTALSASPDTAIKVLAARSAGTSMLSGGVVANQWIPIFRAVTLSIAIGLMPFLVIFLPTPLAPKVLGMIAGFFVWITAWGVTDAVVHQAAMDYGYKVFKEVRDYQLGVTAVMAFGTSSLKTLAAFATIRWSGIMLATVMTWVIIRFGGHAMSMFAGSLIAGPRMAAAGAGQSAVTPEGMAQTVGSARQSGPTLAWANEHSFQSTTRAGLFDKSLKTESALRTMSAMGGAASAVDQMAHKGMISNVEGSAKAGEKSEEIAETAGKVSGARDVAKAKMQMSLADQEHGGDYRESALAQEGAGIQRIGPILGVPGLQALGRISEDRTLDGVVYQKANFAATKGDLSALREWAIDQGHHNFATGLKRMMGSMGDGERVDVNMTGGQGGWATVSAKHGDESFHYDFDRKLWMTKDQSGRERIWSDVDKHMKDHTTTVQKGYKVQKFAVDEYLASWGVKYDSQTAIQSALNRDPRLYDSITNPNLTNRQRDTLMWAVSGQIATGMVSKLDGVDVDTASASLGIGGGMLIKGGSRISAETRSVESVDSRVVDIHNRIARSYEESQSNSLDRVEANQALASTTGTYIDEIYKRAKTEKYGPKNITKNLMMGGEQFSQNQQSGELTEGIDD